MITEIGNGINLHKGKIETRFEGYDKTLGDLERQLNAIETAVARAQFGGGGGSLPGSGLTTFGATAKEHAEKFYGWMRGGSGADELRNLEIKAGLSTLSDPDGGYLVPEEMDKTMERFAMDSVAMRRLARIVTASGDYKKPISAGGATAGWVGEKETREETDSPELKLFSPPWNELFALPEVTQALLDMSDFDVAGWLGDELQIAEAEMEGAGFISGNGVGQPGSGQSIKKTEPFPPYALSGAGRFFTVGDSVDPSGTMKSSWDKNWRVAIQPECRTDKN